jgi:hypothetical protein
MMKRLSAGLFTLALLGLATFLPTAHAQQAATPAIKSAGPLSYDASKEITLSGKVESVVTKHTHGMLWGTHLMLQTTSGKMDASLGRIRLKGKGALTFEAGENVQVTGVIKTVHGDQFLLTRLVKADNHVYTIRNERGIPVAPERRNGASASGSEGGAR